MKCGKPIRYAEREYCHDCQKTEHFYDRGRSLWLHKEPVNTSIYRFKYHNQRVFARYYAEEIVNAFHDEICRWKKMKYGFIVEPLRNLYGLYILYYIWSRKVYKIVLQYLKQAPIYIFDSLVFVGAAIVATIDEWPIIDNEILEECCELLMYIGLVNLTWRYRVGKLV